MIYTENYKIIGCSIYNYTDNMKLYFFWLTSLNSGTTKMLFVDKTRFLKFTLLDEYDYSDHDELSLKCVSCDNIKCTRHKLIQNNNHNFIFSFEYIDDHNIPKEFSSPDCRTLFFGCITRSEHAFAADQRTPVLIAGISKQGLICKILPDDSDNDFSVDESIKLSICSRNFLNTEECTQCTDELSKQTIGILEASISWKIDNYIGINIQLDTKISGFIDVVHNLV